MDPQTPAIPKPTEPVVPPAPPAEVPKPKNNKVVIILLSVLLLTAISATAFFYLQTQKLSKQLAQLQVQPTPTPLSTEIPSPTLTPTVDGIVDEQNRFISNYFNFEIKFPKNWELDFEEYIRGPVYVLGASDQNKLFSIQIYTAKKGGEFLPGPTGYGEGDWKSIGSYTFLNQRLEKTALIYDNNTKDIIYQTSGERSVTFPNQDNLFLFQLNASNKNNVYNIPNSAQAEFEQILSTFRFLK